MSISQPSPTRHDLVAAGAGVASLIPASVHAATPDVQPFQIHMSEDAIIDLKRRVVNTKFPSGELVPDASQGVQLATMSKLADYWEKHHDWRKAEARLNGWPQFITQIDGLDIHFIHLRSKHTNAMPVIITHGWPGSIIEQMKVIGPLTDPTAHGAKAEDAFDVVIPSLTGYGFSAQPTTLGWDPQRIARAWIVLMKRLGYTGFVAQGGDWGDAVTEQMALQEPPELLAIHTNMPATILPTSPSRSPPVGRRRRVSHLMRRAPMSNSTSSTSTASAMRWRWQTARRRSTASGTGLSG
jgi:pimeloyl-ACP methyl ester carboxylesterase